ncbi:phosphotransferase family protein [Halostella litorea]|uniref:phosphotransferase family protein n=1 Tax=Halostella litorea TaxID=2528831 RepID=UPI00109265AC|nr:phosphotransferase [Halostella litorea]
MDDITAVLAAAFPDRSVAETIPTGPSWNPATRTVGVRFTDGRRAFLKAMTDGNGSRVARERAVIEFVGARCDVRVPTVLASNPEGEVPYLATAPIPGESVVAAWHDWTDAERATAARQVGRALAGVHAATFDGHGHVDGGDAEGLTVESKPWTDVLVDTIETLRELSPSDRFDHRFDDVVAAVEANRDVLDDVPATLLHGDPAKPNCIRGDDDVALLDWENAHVGDPARDLYRARAQQLDGIRTAAADRLVEALHEGYRERAGALPAGFAERRPVYRAVRFLGTAGFVDRTAEYVDESADEFAEWVDAELGRRLGEL